MSVSHDERAYEPLTAVFVDRDGVLNKHLPGEYVQNRQMLAIMEGAADAVRRLNDAGIPVIIISNQQGVGKKLMTQEDLDDIDLALRQQLAQKAGARVSRSYYCPHLKEDACSCRKPKSGLLDRALRDFQLDPARTAFIGDSPTDIAAGAAAGIGCKILVLSGATTAYTPGQFGVEPDCVYKSLPEAVEGLLEPGGKK